MHFCSFECCKPHNAARHLMKCDVINDVKLLHTVYRRIYCRKFLTLSNQKERYKSKRIRIQFDCSFEENCIRKQSLKKCTDGAKRLALCIVSSHDLEWNPKINDKMGHNATKPVFRVSDKLRFKPAYLATQTSKKSLLANLDIILFDKQITARMYRLVCTFAVCKLQTLVSSIPI